MLSQTLIALLLMAAVVVIYVLAIKSESRESFDRGDGASQRR
jgi:hypothetical protein